MFLLQLQLTVQLGDGVENLSKVGALEDPKHDGAEGVAHDGAQVGVHCHLEETLSIIWKIWKLSLKKGNHTFLEDFITLFETEMRNVEAI